MAKNGIGCWVQIEKAMNPFLLPSPFLEKTKENGRLPSSSCCDGFLVKKKWLEEEGEEEEEVLFKII